MKQHPQLAAGIGAGTSFSGVIGVFTNIFDKLVGLLLLLIMFFLFWRILTTWFIGGGDPAQVEKGKQSVFVGLIVFVLVFGLWSIVSLVRYTFGLRA